MENLHRLVAIVVPIVIGWLFYLGPASVLNFLHACLLFFVAAAKVVLTIFGLCYVGFVVFGLCAWATNYSLHELDKFDLVVTVLSVPIGWLLCQYSDVGAWLTWLVDGIGTVTSLDTYSEILADWFYALYVAYVFVMFLFFAMLRNCKSSCVWILCIMVNLLSFLFYQYFFEQTILKHPFVLTSHVQPDWSNQSLVWTPLTMFVQATMMLSVLLFVTWAVRMMHKAESLEDVNAESLEDDDAESLEDDDAESLEDDNAESPEDARIRELFYRTSRTYFDYNFNAQTTAANSKFRIRKITKLNNNRLEEAYKTHVHHMPTILHDHRSLDVTDQTRCCHLFLSSAKDVLLFHATPSQNVKNICENGFRIDRFQRGIYGRGIYFTDCSHKADGYSGQGPIRYMFVARVALGKIVHHRAAGVGGHSCIAARHDHYTEYLAFENS